MKLKFTFFALFLATLQVSGQVTYETNDPGLNTPLGYLGWNDNTNEDLLIRQNNDRRMRFTGVNWPGYNDAAALLDVSRIFLGQRDVDNEPTPFSMMQLGENINDDLARDWMNVGTTYGVGGDILYFGIIESPGNSNNSAVTDGVIAWGCNDDNFVPGNGPDNFRFLFLAPTDEPQSPGSAIEGLETMRITPNGNIGMGNSFSNTQQPSTRLEVHEQGEDPQFRVSHTLSPNTASQAHADFQVSAAGDLYIKPVLDGVQGVAIGFLEGEQTAPTAPLGIQTVLDVGGLTRIRNLRSQGDNDCIVIGSNAAGAADNYIKRLDFTGNSTDYLAGDGTWVDLSTTGDLDWETDGTDVWTGHGLNGFPAGDVFIGSTPGINARLSISDVANSASRSGQQIAVDRVGGSGTTRGLNVILADLQDAGFNAGVDSRVRGGKFAVGGRFITDVFNNQSEWSAGVAGYSEGTIDGPVDVIGVYGYAENSNIAGSTFPVGVYGEAQYSGSTPATSIAGHFQGTVQQLFGTITLSDASLKQNIETIENANEILSNLNPVKYNYDMLGTFGIDASEVASHGFIAQDLEIAFPEAVTDFYVPERRDTAGVVTRERSMHLGVKYNEFIALLVKGHQEQNALIDSQAAMLTEQEEANEELKAQIAALSEQLEAQAAEMAEMQSQMAQVMSSFQSTQSKMNNCCGTAPSEESHSESGKNELEQNFPNPFDMETTINFTLAESAQIRLEISDTQGRVLEVLVNENLSAGRYTERWDASAYAPGTYYYSLYADTELLTKKMIKK